MLGHDMRSPLQTIQMTASYLAALNAGEKVSVAASRLIRSGARMQALLDDMLDFNRTKLGLGINIAPTDGRPGRNCLPMNWTWCEQRIRTARLIWTWWATARVFGTAGVCSSCLATWF